MMVLSLAFCSSRPLSHSTMATGHSRFGQGMPANEIILYYLLHDLEINTDVWYVRRAQHASDFRQALGAWYPLGTGCLHACKDLMLAHGMPVEMQAHSAALQML